MWGKAISSILVVGLIPVVTALLAQLLGKERLGWTTLGALLSGFMGVIIIVFQRPLTVTLVSGFLFGAVCLIGNAFAFAAYSTLSKRWMQRVSPLVMTGGTMMSIMPDKPDGSELSPELQYKDKLSHSCPRRYTCCRVLLHTCLRLTETLLYALPRKSKSFTEILLLRSPKWRVAAQNILFRF